MARNRKIISKGYSQLMLINLEHDIMANSFTIVANNTNIKKTRLKRECKISFNNLDFTLKQNNGQEGPVQIRQIPALEGTMMMLR